MKVYKLRDTVLTFFRKGRASSSVGDMFLVETSDGDLFRIYENYGRLQIEAMHPLLREESPVGSNSGFMGMDMVIEDPLTGHSFPATRALIKHPTKKLRERVMKQFSQGLPPTQSAPFVHGGQNVINTTNTSNTPNIVIQGDSGRGFGKKMIDRMKGY